MRAFIFSLFVIGYLSLTTPVAADTIVRWTDENGVTHFANRAPIGQVTYEEVSVQPANKVDVPTRELGAGLRQAFAAIEQNRSTEKRSDVVIKGPPKKVLTPMARPSTKRSNRGYRASFQ